MQLTDARLHGMGAGFGFFIPLAANGTRTHGGKVIDNDFNYSNSLI